MQTQTPEREGHPIVFADIDIDAIDGHGDGLQAIFEQRQCGIIVRGALSEAVRQACVDRLSSGELSDRWTAPNAGMTGGEIRTIGDAATPTFTALRGPSVERYGANAEAHAQRAAAIFGQGDPGREVAASLLSRLFGGRPAAPPKFAAEVDWNPYNVRALDPGEQIYSHHDNHFGLEVYTRMDPDLDRSTLLSFFVTLQAPDAGGELVVYGLWGSDPNPPMLPTRFIDTETLERRFEKHVCNLRAGDLVVFDAGRFVHRVTPVEGTRPRLTFGGFLTVDPARTRLAFWS